jgi:hypothetical protein
MRPILSPLMVAAGVLALGIGAAQARGGHGGSGPGGGFGGGHGMSSGGHGNHDGGDGDRGGEHDRDDGFAHGDGSANTGPCGMGWGWTDGPYCAEPSTRLGGSEPTQKAEAPAKR